MRVLGDKTFEKWLYHEDGALMKEISALVKEVPQSSLFALLWENTINSFYAPTGSSHHALT